METKVTSVLITGGAGFIGSQIADAYLRKSAQIIVVDDLSSGSKKWLPKNCTFYALDLNDTASLKKILADHHPDFIHHCAGHAQLRTAQTQPLINGDGNIRATLSLIQALIDTQRQTSYKPSQIIFSSSAAVYSGDDNPPFNEKKIPNPTNPYGIAKLASEKYFEWYSEQTGVRVTNLRYANVYGPRQSQTGEAGVVAKFLSALIRGKEIEVYANGEHQRDYIFVSDVVSANIVAVEKGISGVYTVGTGTPTSSLELAKLCTNLFTPSKHFTLRTKEVSEQAVSYLDSTKLQRKTGWEAKVSLKEGLQETLDWYKTQLGK